jgi:hypothetical protein
MKKPLIILILGLSFYCCKKELKNQVKAGNEKPEIRKELRFSLYNSTEFELKDITVGLPDTVLTYNRLEKHSQTEWINIESAYNYGFVRFYDGKNRKYYVQPIDYAGEKLYKTGEMKFIIKSIDTLEQFFELDGDYKNN